MSEHGWPEDPLGEHGFGDPVDPADPAGSADPMDHLMADPHAGLGDYHSFDGGHGGQFDDGYGDHRADHAADHAAEYSPDHDEHGFGAADGWSDVGAHPSDTGSADGYWHDYTDGIDGGHVDHGPGAETVHGLHGADGVDSAGDVADGSEDGALLDSEHLAQPLDAETFPPHLELDVTPTDGREWVDVDLLGSGEQWGTMSMTDSTTDLMSGLVVPESPQALLADLHQFDGGDGMPSWTTVAGSDDPAVRALALHWQGH